MSTDLVRPRESVKPETIPEEEYMFSGHAACPGCGGALAMRHALKALGEKTIVVIPASCWSIIAGAFPSNALQVPLMHTAFATGGAAAAGISAALQMQGDTETTVLTWAGDGGTFDIGIQALSGAAERNEDFIYACYDNEAYMNTGIQRSSATPWGAWTTTTPVSKFKQEPKKDIVGIMVAHRIPYAATASVAYLEDLVYKFRKAKSIRGTKFIHILAPCPPGWKSEPSQSIKIARLAVQSKVFPLYEVEKGEKYTVNVWPEKPRPVREYLQLQGRFRHLSAVDLETIQHNVDCAWEELVKKAKESGTC